MLGNVLRFGAGEGVIQGVEIGEKGMREGGGKTMGHCFTSEEVIITTCECQGVYHHAFSSESWIIAQITMSARFLIHTPKSSQLLQHET